MNDSIYETVDLSKFDDDYRKAQQADTPQPYRPVPDGRYQVVVETVELTKTRTTNNPMVKWRLRISGPTMADRLLWKNRVITERTLGFVAKELTLCGVTMQSFNELPARLQEMVGLRLEISKRSRDGHEDIYFDKNLTAGPAAHAATAGSDSGSAYSAGYDKPYDAAERSVRYDEELSDDLPF